ncbi:hypothetical protein RJ640_028856 [Escallonia rubra]|uniref:F-box domain-containing protein n=1 Tax=Escallonia rubra TaxID=112253 RepID=A0AA88R1A1_9ASTE|nr:hypothetical protein RJ640_028856 [Escallonia rubra]
MEGAMDRISQLPELIIHHILSFLSGKEAAQTSALSKTWLSAWSTNPVLDLDESYFGKDALGTYQENPETEGKRQKFMKLLRDTMIRYREQKARIKRLVLHVYFVDSNLVSVADEWIGLALENHVEELDLFIRTPPSCRRYALPQAIFTASRLTELRLRDCKLEHVDGSGVIKCHALRILRLRSVDTDKLAIQNLISSCPLIQELCIKYCDGWEKIQIGNLHNLKKLEISASIGQIFDISAPSLEFFTYQACKNASCVPELSGIRTSPNLKVLLLDHVTITDSFLGDLILELPVLEGHVVSEFGGFAHKVEPIRALAELQVLLLQTWERFRLQNIKFETWSLISVHVALLDGLLWSCSPEILSLHLEADFNNELLLTYLKEATMGTVCCNCCSSHRHYLKEVKFEIVKEIHKSIGEMAHGLLKNKKVKRLMRRIKQLNNKEPLQENVFPIFSQYS